MISLTDYCVLLELDDRWKWIISDEHSQVFVSEDKPSFYNGTWDNGDGEWMYVENSEFDCIDWLDEEPHYVPDLIKEYESEEKEVKKDKKWLVDKWTKERNEADVHDPMYQYASEFIADINQLDEPEVLPQELPVIPKYVADYLDFAKSDVPLMRVMELANTRNEWSKWEKEYDWISANDETFARAWLDGYTVEEEQKFYVMSNDNRMMLVRMTDDKTIKESDPFPIDGLYDTEKKFYRLTEQEIKDYDPRYWPFRKPVEEVEEK